MNTEQASLFDNMALDQMNRATALAAKTNESLGFLGASDRLSMPSHFQMPDAPDPETLQRAATARRQELEATTAWGPVYEGVYSGTRRLFTTALDAVGYSFGLDGLINYASQIRATDAERAELFQDNTYQRVAMGVAQSITQVLGVSTGVGMLAKGAAATAPLTGPAGLVAGAGIAASGFPAIVAYFGLSESFDAYDRTKNVLGPDAAFWYAARSGGIEAGFTGAVGWGTGRTIEATAGKKNIAKAIAVGVKNADHLVRNASKGALKDASKEFGTNLLANIGAETLEELPIAVAQMLNNAYSLDEDITPEQALIAVHDITLSVIASSILFHGGGAAKTSIMNRIATPTPRSQRAYEAAQTAFDAQRGKLDTKAETSWTLEATKALTASNDVATIETDLKAAGEVYRQFASPTGSLRWKVDVEGPVQAHIAKLQAGETAVDIAANAPVVDISQDGIKEVAAPENSTSEAAPIPDVPIAADMDQATQTLVAEVLQQQQKKKAEAKKKKAADIVPPEASTEVVAEGSTAPVEVAETPAIESGTTSAFADAQEAAGSATSLLADPRLGAPDAQSKAAVQDALNAHTILVNDFADKKTTAQKLAASTRSLRAKQAALLERLNKSRVRYIVEANDVADFVNLDIKPNEEGTTRTSQEKFNELERLEASRNASFDAAIDSFLEIAGVESAVDTLGEVDAATAHGQRMAEGGAYGTAVEATAKATTATIRDQFKQYMRTKIDSTKVRLIRRGEAGQTLPTEFSILGDYIENKDFQQRLLQAWQEFKVEGRLVVPYDVLSSSTITMETLEQLAGDNAYAKTTLKDVSRALSDVQEADKALRSLYSSAGDSKMPAAKRKSLIAQSDTALKRLDSTRRVLERQIGLAGIRGPEGSLVPGFESVVASKLLGEQITLDQTQVAEAAQVEVPTTQQILEHDKALAQQSVSDMSTAMLQAIATVEEAITRVTNDDAAAKTMQSKLKKLKAVQKTLGRYDSKPLPKSTLSYLKRYMADAEVYNAIVRVEDARNRSASPVEIVDSLPKNAASDPNVRLASYEDGANSMVDVATGKITLALDHISEYAKKWGITLEAAIMGHIVHEGSVHLGVKSLLGDGHMQAMGEIGKSIRDTEQGQVISSLYPDNYANYTRDQTIGEEYLARVAQRIAEGTHTPQDVTLWSAFKDRVRQWLLRSGLGQHVGMTWSERDIEFLAQTLIKHSRGKTFNVSTTVSAEGKAALDAPAFYSRLQSTSGEIFKAVPKGLLPRDLKSKLWNEVKKGNIPEAEMLWNDVDGALNGLPANERVTAEVFNEAVMQTLETFTPHYAKTDADMRFMFGGRIGAESNPHLTQTEARAHQMAKDFGIEPGKKLERSQHENARKIGAETGWWPGLDGKLRWWEDFGRMIAPGIHKQMIRHAETSTGTAIYTLKQFLGEDHKLFTRYPQLKQVQVEYKRGKHVSGSSEPGLIRIFGDPYMAPAVAYHEVQHQVQAFEGHSRGASMQSEAVENRVIEKVVTGVKSPPQSPSELENAMYQEYASASGEVESRVAEATSEADMNAAEAFDLLYSGDAGDTRVAYDDIWVPSPATHAYDAMEANPALDESLRRFAEQHMLRAKKYDKSVPTYGSFADAVEARYGKHKFFGEITRSDKPGFSKKVQSAWDAATKSIGETTKAADQEKATKKVRKTISAIVNEARKRKMFTNPAEAVSAIRPHLTPVEGVDVRQILADLVAARKQKELSDIMKSIDEAGTTISVATLEAVQQKYNESWNHGNEVYLRAAEQAQHPATVAEIQHDLREITRRETANEGGEDLRIAKKSLQELLRSVRGDEAIQPQDIVGKMKFTAARMGQQMLKWTSVEGYLTSLGVPQDGMIALKSMYSRSQYFFEHLLDHAEGKPVRALGKFIKDAPRVMQADLQHHLLLWAEGHPEYIAKTRELFKDQPEMIQRLETGAIVVRDAYAQVQAYAEQHGWSEGFQSRKQRELESDLKRLLSKKRPDAAKVEDLRQRLEILDLTSFVHIPREFIKNTTDTSHIARKSLTLYGLMQSNGYDVSAIHTTDMMVDYFIRQGRDLAAYEVAHALRTSGLSRAGTAADDSTAWVNGSDIHAVFKGQVLDARIAEAVSAQLRPGRAYMSQLRKFFNLTKIKEFFNPVVMPAYDTIQGLMLGVVPGKGIYTALKDIQNHTDAHGRAVEQNVFSKPAGMTHTGVTKRAVQNGITDNQQYLRSILTLPSMREVFQDLSSGQPRADVFNSIDKLFHENALAGMYAAARDLAWMGDGVIRQAAFNTMEKRYLARGESAEAAAILAGKTVSRAFGDYADTPTPIRRALTLPFFTPVYTFEMMKAVGKNAVDVTKVLRKLTNGQAVPQDILQGAKTLATMYALKVAIQLGMQAMGFERDDEKWWDYLTLGRKFTKPHITKAGLKAELKIVMGGPLVVLDREINRFLRIFDVSTPAEIPGSAYRSLSTLAHPLFGNVTRLFAMEDRQGNPYFEPHDDQIVKIGKSAVQIAADWVPMLGMAFKGVNPELAVGYVPDENREEALGNWYSVGTQAFNMLYFPYVAEPKERRVANQIKREQSGYMRSVREWYKTRNTPPPEAWLRNLRSKVEALQEQR